MRIAAAYVAGLVFGLGIAISGMANPVKVLNFFDLAGSWDPSLAFVMGSALIVTFAGYHFVLKRSRPLVEERFQIPHNRNIDIRLIGGSVLFGIGWGISGFCPGGALPALGTGRTEAILFVLALVAGILAAQAITRLSQNNRAAPQTGRA
jgi:hypothetical protein